MQQIPKRSHYLRCPALELCNRLCGPLAKKVWPGARFWVLTGFDSRSVTGHTEDLRNSTCGLSFSRSCDQGKIIKQLETIMYVSWIFWARFQNCSIQLAWFSWLFRASLVSRCSFWCGNPVKPVRPGCVHTPSLWDWSSNLGNDGLWRHRCNSAPDESAKESSYSVVSNLWVATPLGVALIFSGVAVTRHMLAVLVQVRCA